MNDERNRRVIERYWPPLLGGRDHHLASGAGADDDQVARHQGAD